MSAAFKKIYALQELGITNGIIEGAAIRIQQKKREEKPLDPDLPTWKGGALGSFRKGLCMLPESVAEHLGNRVRLQWTMTGLSRGEDGRYVAVYDTPEGRQPVVAKSVALTAPARAAAGILKDVAPGAEAIADIHYPTVWTITLAYPKTEFKEPLSGFGNLIPRSMDNRMLGTIWSSCLFPGRAPEGMELLLSYIGGAQDPGIKDLKLLPAVLQTSTWCVPTLKLLTHIASSKPTSVYCPVPLSSTKHQPMEMAVVVLSLIHGSKQAIVTNLEKSIVACCAAGRRELAVRATFRAVEFGTEARFLDSAAGVIFRAINAILPEKGVANRLAAPL